MPGSRRAPLSAKKVRDQRFDWLVMIGDLQGCLPPLETGSAVGPSGRPWSLQGSVSHATGTVIVQCHVQLATLCIVNASLRSCPVAMATKFLASLALVRHSCKENLGQHLPNASPHFPTPMFTCSLRDFEETRRSRGLASLGVIVTHRLGVQC